MSNKAVALAFRAKLEPADKLLLLTLADLANEEFACWPMRTTLADRTGLKPGRLTKAIGALEAGGWISRDGQALPAGRTVYQLNRAKLSAQ